MTEHHPPPLPGPCVPIPYVRTPVRDADGYSRWIVETHVVPHLDLDGAGSPVVLVPPEREAVNLEAMYWRLFVQRGDCGHELATVPGISDPEPEAGVRRGLRDFSVVESLPADQDDDTLAGIGVTVYCFDGRRYVGGETDIR
ncbi:hypothetical protein [Halomonas cerina]|uniref:Uncharacterized protein n=1 Tax=Halomonas cerina TaxID=447424 RepID=A0A839VCL3_9GAMM|nr:hypothetical protein [Halomonas cerina]MBB3191858.1 hypothetical protein [Halomonas cerina]